MTKNKTIALIAAVIVAALAAFLLLTQAQRERARIEAEIAQVKDSLEMNRNSYQVFQDSLYNIKISKIRDRKFMLYESVDVSSIEKKIYDKARFLMSNFRSCFTPNFCFPQPHYGHRYSEGDSSRIFAEVMTYFTDSINRVIAFEIKSKKCSRYRFSGDTAYSLPSDPKCDTLAQVYLARIYSPLRDTVLWDFETPYGIDSYSERHRKSNKGVLAVIRSLDSLRSDSNSVHYFFHNKNLSYRSRLDSLNRRLKELPPK